MELTKLIIDVEHAVPSLNKMFGMNHWQRRREKKDTQDAFQSSLRLIEDGCSTKTTYASNTSWTVSDMLGLFRMTIHKQSTSRSAKSKSAKARKSLRGSK